ncbi:unnamed protein product [Gordionus sp. m RMFG-2023]
MKFVDTLYHRAAKEDCLDLLKRSNTKDLNSPDHNGMTPTHWAAFYGNIDSLRIIAGKSGDIEKPDKIGNTAMHYASMNGHLNCVSFLVSFSANLWALNNEYKTALDLAALRDHYIIVKYLDTKISQRIGIDGSKVTRLKAKSLKEASKRIKSSKYLHSNKSINTSFVRNYQPNFDNINYTLKSDTYSVPNFNGNKSSLDSRTVSAQNPLIEKLFKKLNMNSLSTIKSTLNKSVKEDNYASSNTPHKHFSSFINGDQFDTFVSKSQDKIMGHRDNYRQTSPKIHNPFTRYFPNFNNSDEKGFNGGSNNIEQTLTPRSIKKIFTNKFSVNDDTEPFTSRKSDIQNVTRNKIKNANNLYSSDLCGSPLSTSIYSQDVEIDDIFSNLNQYINPNDGDISVFNQYNHLTSNHKFNPAFKPSLFNIFTIGRRSKGTTPFLYSTLNTKATRLSMLNIDGIYDTKINKATVRNFEEDNFFDNNNEIDQMFESLSVKKSFSQNHLNR